MTGVGAVIHDDEGTLLELLLMAKCTDSQT